MLSRFDDLPIHQVPKPITTPASTDRNAYDRYWIGALHCDGAYQVEVAFGRYPNLRVTDGAVSISRDGEQWAFHASREAPVDPADLTIGPFRLEIVEPMLRFRVILDDGPGNDSGMTCDLTWHARVGALEEDHTVMKDGPTVTIDMLRFIQFGTWEGTVTAGGVTTTLRRDETVGIRDRSWGIRPVGETPPGRPRSHGGHCWLWAPIHFDDECRVVGYFQRPGGQIWRPDGHIVPVVDPVVPVTANDAPGVERIVPSGQRLTFARGSRRVTHAEIDVVREDGSAYVLDLEPIARFDMRALGYTNPDWGHGHWKGELATGHEHWRFADLDPLDPTHQHIHHTVRARVRDERHGDREGVGLLEQIIFGPHTQFGFSDLLDGAR